MSNSNRRHSIDEVLTALHLCGPDYHNGACEKCPFIRECLPGDNDALVAEAALTIETLLRMNDEAMARLARFAEFLQTGNITVFVIGHKWHRGRSREEYWINTGRFRVADLDKLGKTVFMKKADAEKEIRRLQHGYR